MASTSYRISGIEPPDYDSRPDLHEEFWQAVVRFGLIEKDDELARGIGVDGAELAKLKPSTIAHRRSAMGPADPHAPPLIPAHGLSRSRSLLAGRAHAKDRYALFYWRFDPVSGGPFGKILAIHREGTPGRMAARNVIGISPAGRASVQAKAWAWWELRKRGKAPLPQVPKPQIPAGVKFVVRDVPKYKPTNASASSPTANRRIGQIEINGHHYTLQGGSNAQIRRMIANETFTGFRKPGELKGLGGTAPRTPFVGPGPKPTAKKAAQPKRPKATTTTAAKKPTLGSPWKHTTDRADAIAWGQAHGVVLTPGMDGEVPTAGLNMVNRELAKLPREVHAIVVGEHRTVQVFVGPGITVHPDLQHMKGLVPRGWEGSGRTWDSVPGGGGSNTYLAVNSLGSGHGCVNLVLHEHAHTYDDAIRARNRKAASDEPEWMAVHDAVKWASAYQAKYPEESFAESLAAYYHSEESRARLDPRVQEYFRKRFGA